MNITAESFLLPVFILLVGGNAYFIRRLIDKVAVTSEVATGSMAKLSAITAQLVEIKTKVENLRSLEIDIAVLKATAGWGRHRKAAAHSADETDNGGNGDA